jgi:hypothetical protein
MGIANYTNLSELMNETLKSGLGVSVSDLVRKAQTRGLILASEGTLADKSELENGFIALVEVLHRAGAILPVPASETELRLIRLFESGELAADGYGGVDGDRFIEIKWKSLIDNLPVIVNL